MGWDDPNVYYNPEQFGLEQVAQIDYSDGCYCFDYRVVWRHTETRTLYSARDSGCSCPTPFEDFHKIEDLQEFGNGEWIIREAKEEASGDWYHGDPADSFIRAVGDLADGGK